MGEKLTVAVVGVGYLGRHHARIYSSMPDVDLVGVVDTNPENAERVAANYNTRSFGDYHDLPDDLQAVSVSTPTTSHHEIASHFLGKGTSVLVEKPMTATLEEAEALHEAASRSDATLQVGHIERFNPAIMAIRELKVEPKFIESHRLAPFKFRCTDVGVVMDLMIHDLDIILELCQSPVSDVRAVGGAILAGTEDIASARIEFESGALANITASRVSFKSLRRTRVFSSDSFISLDYEKKYALLARKSKDLDLGKFEAGGLDTGNVEDLKKLLMTDLIQVKELRLDEYEPLQKELESFVESVRSRRSPLVPSSHGVRSIRLANSILESLQRHKW